MISKSQADSLSQASILVVGLARNCEEKLFLSVSSLSRAFSLAKTVSYLVIESDSSDRTVDVLSKLASQIKEFEYVSFGSLVERLQLRTERIAFCRNYYLRLIQESSKYLHVDYVVIADLDGVNAELAPQSVASCWCRSDWDVCTANQNGPYYDIWALRHPLWSPNDCFEQEKMMQSLGVRRFKAIYISTFSRMIRIPIHHDWIEVNSAFGGLAIYRKSVLMNVCYEGLNPSGREVCEHVSIHRQIGLNGGEIFINPSLINASITEHSRNATFLGMIKLWFFCQVLDVFKYLGFTSAIKLARKSLNFRS